MSSEVIEHAELFDLAVTPAEICRALNNASAKGVAIVSVIRLDVIPSKRNAWQIYIRGLPAGV